jgi:hypothetical protein
MNANEQFLPGDIAIAHVFQDQRVNGIASPVRREVPAFRDLNGWIYASPAPIGEGVGITSVPDHSDGSSGVPVLRRLLVLDPDDAEAAAKLLDAYYGSDVPRTGSGQGVARLQQAMRALAEGGETECE